MTDSVASAEMIATSIQETSSINKWHHNNSDTKMIANANSPEPEFPQPSEQCLFCKKEGVKGGGVGFVICDLFRYEFMQYKTVQFDEYSMCFKCGSVLNYVVYIKRLLLTTLFGLPLAPPIFTRELPEMSMNINENVRFILHSNMQNEIDLPVPNGRKNGLRLSPHISIQEPLEQGFSSNSPLLLVTHSTDEEPANVGYHDYRDDGLHVRRTRSASRYSNRSESVHPKRPQSEPRTRSRKSNVSPERSKSQISVKESEANQYVCKWLNCLLVCLSEKELMIHYDEFHKIKCLKCRDVSFQSRSMLLQHKKEVHLNECKTCKVKFAPDKIWAHRRASHKYNCPYCDLKFPQLRYLTEHINSEHQGRRMFEWTYLNEIGNDTEIKSTSSSNKKRETEIIFLNNNNNNQAKALSITPTNLSDKIKENFKNTPEISNNTPSINENIIESVSAQQNTEELDRTDSGVEYVNSKSLVACEANSSIITEGELNTIGQLPTSLSPKITSEITNESVETKATSTKSPGEVSLETPASDSGVPSSLNSPNSSALVSSKSNRRRGRRRLTSVVVEYDKLPQHCAATTEVTATSLSRPNNIDALDIPNTSYQDKNDESSRKAERRLRKRKALLLDPVNVSPKPSPPRKINTRSRSRRQIAVNVQISIVSVETTFEAYDTEAMHDENNVTLISQSPEEKLAQKSKHKVKINANTTDENLSSQIPKKRRKRLQKNTENLETDVSFGSITKVNVNPIEEVIVNKYSVAAEKECDALYVPSPPQDGASKTLKNTLDVASHENAISDSIDIDDKETNNPDNPSPLQETMSTATPKPLFIPEEKHVRIKLTSVDNLPSVAKELDNKVLSTKDEQEECTKNSETLDASNTSVKQNIEVEKENEPIVSSKVPIVEGHESSDSLSPWYIHEEGFSCDEVSPEATTNDIPNDAQEDTKSEIPAANRYNIILLNLDKVIESVVMAEDLTNITKSCIENSPSSKISKNSSKNAKSEKLSSISKPNKSLEKKSNKYAEVSIQSALPSLEATAATSSDDSPPLKATQKPEDEISAKTAGSPMKSVAKYMLATTPSAISFKIKSTDFSLSNAPDDPDHTDSTFTKPTSNNTTNSANVSVGVLSVGISKTNRRARNGIQKERSHRRATTFADFTGNIHCAPAEVPTIESLADLKTNSKQVPSDRIPKPDVYTFPETDNTEPSSSSHNTSVGLKNTDSTGVSKMVRKSKKNPENVEANQYGPIKKKRVKSKPKRNTAFDIAITEASQLYLRK